MLKKIVSVLGLAVVLPLLASAFLEVVPIRTQIPAQLVPPGLESVAYAEPGFKALSVSQTVTSYTFAPKTQTVTLFSPSGSDTCYYRLFTNVDTAAAATTSNSALAAGETITYTIKRSTTDVSVDSEGQGSWYKSISAICASSDTATWRIYYK